MEKQKFYQLFKNGLISADGVDDCVQEWHEGNSTETLRDYLGMNEMTDEEYSNFIVRGTLKNIYERIGTECSACCYVVTKEDVEETLRKDPEGILKWECPSCGHSDAKEAMERWDERKV